jgi:hypothetical protein
VITSVHVSNTVEEVAVPLKFAAAAFNEIFTGAELLKNRYTGSEAGLGQFEFLIINVYAPLAPELPVEKVAV